MAGYDYEAGMSNNAVAAYAEGLAPLSNITTARLKAIGWKHSLSFAKWLAKNGYWKRAEWHHSGKFANKTNFYDPQALLEIDDLEEKFIEFNTKIEAVKNRVSGRYATFSGSRNRPTFDGYVQFTGEKRDDWIYIDGGGRKKASGNHIEFRYEMPAWR